MAFGARRRIVVRWAPVDAHADPHGLLRDVVAALRHHDPAAVDVDQVCDDCGRPHGRPRVRVGGRPGPHVSLARSVGLVVVAVADREVGIDLERAGPGRVPSAEVVLSPVELAAAQGLDPAAVDALVLRTWVRKEAVLKATGHGLRVDPTLLTLAEGPLRLAAWGGPGRRPALALADVETEPGYLAAVACRSRGRLVIDARPASDVSG